MENTNNQSVESITYILTKTTLKNGKFHYKVTDNNGNIISERKSNRDYVACTIDGWAYFGRLDLIGKGDHGRRIKYYKDEINWSFDRMKKALSGYMELTPEKYVEIINNTKEKLQRVQNIAYLNK